MRVASFSRCGATVYARLQTAVQFPCVSVGAGKRGSASRSCLPLWAAWVTLLLKLADPVDFSHAGEAPEICGELCQVAQVEGLNDKLHVGRDVVGVGL